MWVLPFIRASAAKPNTGWSYRECCLISSGKIWEQRLAGGKCSVNGSCSLFSHRQALPRPSAPQQLVIQREGSPFFPRKHTAHLLAAPRTLPRCGPALGWDGAPWSLTRPTPVVGMVHRGSARRDGLRPQERGWERTPGSKGHPHCTAHPRTHTQSPMKRRGL